METDWTSRVLDWVFMVSSSLWIFARLALAGRLPGAAWTMERAYRLFLRARPVLQRWASRLDHPA